ncbi:MAG: hypothetical protein WCZ47_00290 [Bacilli bacterium]|nr:hypothetical protein [Erysipelotrichia bacterium]
MPLWITSITFLILSFISMIAFGLINFFEEQKVKYSFLQMFPYELSSQSRGKYYILHRLFLYFYVAFSLTPALLLFMKYQSYQQLSSFLLFVNVLFIIQAIIFLSLNIIEARFIKTHATIATLYFAFSLLSSGGASIFLINLYINSSDNLVTQLVIGVLLVLISILLLVIMLNPRLKNWPQLEQVNNIDGTQSLKRPKIFILAFSEWLVVFLNFIAYLLILIAYL